MWLGIQLLFYLIRYENTGAMKSVKFLASCGVIKFLKQDSPLCNY
jgi:hypothetical protein